MQGVEEKAVVACASVVIQRNATVQEASHND